MGPHPAGRKRPHIRRIGEVLVAEGRLSQAAVNRALGFQRLSGSSIRLGTILVTWDLLDEESLLTALAHLHRCEPVSWLTLATAPEEVVRLLSPTAAIRLGALPYERAHGSLRVAFQNPSNLATVDEAAILLRRRVLPGVTSEVRMLEAHHRFYGRPIPREFRAAVQKLKRFTGSVAPESGQDLDFRAPDLLTLEGSDGSPGAAPPSEQNGFTAKAVKEIPVVAERSLPPPPDFYGPPPRKPGSGTAGDSIPSDTKRPPAAESVRAATEEGFPRRLEPAQRSSPASEPARRSSPPSEPAQGFSLPSEPEKGRAEQTTSAKSLPPRDVSSFPTAPREEREVSGMWRSSLLAEEEHGAVSGMWTNSSETGSPAPETGGPEQIVQAAVETHLADFPRALYLECGPSGIVAQRGRGEGMTQGLAGLEVGPNARSVFRHVLRSGAAHFGPLEPELWPRSFAKVLGPRAPDCAVFPIRVSGDVAAFLYADRLGRPMLDSDFGTLARAAVWVSGALSRIPSNRERGASSRSV